MYIILPSDFLSSFGFSFLSFNQRSAYFLVKTEMRALKASKEILTATVLACCSLIETSRAVATTPLPLALSFRPSFLMNSVKRSDGEGNDVFPLLLSPKRLQPLL